MWPSRAVQVAALLGLSMGVACSFRFSDEVRYSCVGDADCGGDGFVCTTKGSAAGSCCKKTGKEVCGDGVDNDCNGLIDAADSWPSETCNGLDDDCDGKIDEDFDFRFDPTNCGKCGTGCAANESCTNGTCLRRAESNCSDGLDNDGNGKIDCEEVSCNLELCGPGCQCQALRKVERNCIDGLDNDNDSAIDCADDSCAGAGCGDGGCFCESLKKKESDCADGRDNDDDTSTDCNDTDCGGKVCQAGTTFRCSGTQCLCNGGGVVAETGTKCRDNVDNDCNGLLDCQETACDQQLCNPDGGAGCRCVGGAKTETTCNDRLDNDGDGSTDCGDSADCPAGTGCTFLNGQGQVTSGTCDANKLCQ